VIDQVKQVASGLLGVEIREEIIGIAEVRDVFRSSKLGVAGSMVIEGVVKRNKPIRVLRDSVVIFEGELESAAPLQGERRGSPQRYRMRYRGEGLQRRQAG
jgi:translation initiation factor IF-2